MTDRVIPLPDGRFSVSREDLELFRRWGLELSEFCFEGFEPEAKRINAISAALKDATDETA